MMKKENERKKERKKEKENNKQWFSDEVRVLSTTGPIHLKSFPGYP